jgi:hypothetical protein
MAYVMPKPRSGKPVRLSLAYDLGHEIDGGWWPYTAAIADELADLVAALDSRLGKVAEIDINWAPMHNPPNLNWKDWQTRPQHIMAIKGDQARANVLVVPCTTSSNLAAMVLRRAAGLPVVPARNEDGTLNTAEEILKAARKQCI